MSTLLKSKMHAAIAGHDAVTLAENECDSFMVAVWGIKDGQLSLVGRSTWKFPLGDVKAAVNQLTENMKTEEAEIAPLPAADLSFVNAPEIWSDGQ